ncbi:MAG: MFS transporter [Methylobacterium sp. SCN 67-24]|nr:MAG: MFS transporter [Methylobacterium sp. SCN 67-24]
MAILLLAGFMNLIDVTIVNVALPRLQSGLGATSSQIEWVVAAYVLAFALGLLPFGRLGDVVGRKRLFLVGVTSFTVFSALCGLAPTMATLIAARVLQGLAGAMMMPQVLAITQVIFPPQERGFAFSLFGLTAGLASVAGPLAGGTLISADIYGLDWRPIFLVNIPIGILAVIAGRALIPDMAGRPELTQDPVGIVIASVAVFLLVFPLIEGHAYGWPWWTFVMIALSVVAMAVFFLHQKARAKRELSQLLPVALMTNGNFVLGSAMTMTFFSGVAGFFLVLAVFLQTGFGLTPLQSGLTTVPFPIGVLIASLISGRLGSRWPLWRIVAGALVMVIGMGWLRFVVANVGDAVDHWRFFLPLLACGFGMGITISSLFQTVLSTVPPRDAGSGSGAVQAFQQMGAALGIAVTGQIFFSTLDGRASEPPHVAFVSAMEHALVYEMAAFALVAAMVFFLKPAAPQGSTGQSVDERRPLPVEM